MKLTNRMQNVRVEKITLNIGVGQAGDELKKAEEILKRITGKKPIQTICKIKQPTWGIREGLPIGVKVTIRGKKALEFLKTAFAAKEKKLKAASFDALGNFGFGIKEYIDLPGAKYDPKLGMKGFDVLVTLEKPGYRIKRRMFKTKKISKHAVKKEEAMEFIRQTFGVEVA
ncbi:MAG: 50S ribosomal protein L5 [Candidatus Diapherotrites archaeon]|nr:50S ribosomal protein L5 [Candidatus Diapherotrites archaeon]